MDKPKFFKGSPSNPTPVTVSRFSERKIRTQDMKISKNPFHFITGVVKFLFIRIPKHFFQAISYLFSKPGLKHLKDNFLQLSRFLLLLFLYLFSSQIINPVLQSRFFPWSLSNYLRSAFAKFYVSSISTLDKPTGSISRLDLIELSLRNMQAKKTRTMVTIGGMAIGIGAIVFLVSIGYGLQQLVIYRVARLDEMKQVHVYPHAGS